MFGPRAIPIDVSPRQRTTLEQIERASSTSQQLAERCRVVLLATEGDSNESIGRALGVDRQLVRRWRRRWAEGHKRLCEAEDEGATDAELGALIVGVLTDEKRCGAPMTFTPEQVASIIALACEPPADSGLPVSHWTPPELAREAIKRGVVESISPRQVDRFLARRAFGHTSRSTG
jgi:putative transposase